MEAAPLVAPDVRGCRIRRTRALRRWRAQSSKWHKCPCPRCPRNRDKGNSNSISEPESPTSLLDPCEIERRQEQSHQNAITGKNAGSTSGSSNLSALVASECDSQTGVSVPLRESPAARGALRQLRAPLSLRPRSIAYECDHRQEYRFHCKCKRTGTSAGSSAFTASLLRAGCQHLPWALPSAAGRGSRAQRAR